MTNVSRDPAYEQVELNITLDQLQNKSKKAKITKDASSAVVGLLNGCCAGKVILRSMTQLTPAAVDELVRSIEQSLIEIVGLTSFREYSQTKIEDGEIIFLIRPGDRIYTIEYNLVLPTDFQVRQVLRTDPLEKIAPILNSGPLDNTTLQCYAREFHKDVKAPDDLRESDTVQFKKIKSDKNKNKSTADRILANKVTHYIAAFANHKGGHVYIGIDDETYAVYGQNISEEEKGRILEKMESAITSMVWPDENGKPKRGAHWDIAFTPVLDVAEVKIPNLFVIIISVARCPGGVFLTVPESYVVQNGKVKEMKFGQWKKRILHDAHMRDIVKCCRENGWEGVTTCKRSNDCKLNSSLVEAEGSVTSAQTTNFESRCETLTVAIPLVKHKTTKRLRMCQKITDHMEQLIQDGDFDELQEFARKSRRMPETFSDSDTKVAVGFMLALGAYRQRKFPEAYKELSKASFLITSTENHMEFEIQRLHLLSCFLRGERKYSESYEVACGGLQQMESISPGWHTAWMLNDTGYLFSILAGDERNEEVRQSLKLQACNLYAKAISHTSRIDNDATQSRDTAILKSNLLHRCHLRLAMTSLGCTPLADECSDLCLVSSGDIEVAIANILAVEKNSLKEDCLTDVNQCYLYLVKSDFNYRKSQLRQDRKRKFLKQAEEYAAKAQELAKLDQFPGILKYSESRRRRFSKLDYVSSRKDKPLVDLNDE